LRIKPCLTTLICILIFGGNPARAQQKGQYMPGQQGLNAGVLPDPGFTYANMTINYSADTLKNAGGSSVPLTGTTSGRSKTSSITFPSSNTYGNVFFWRGFVVDGSTATAVEATKKMAKVYSLAQATNPPPMKFINVSGKAFNTIHANDFTFYEEINHVVQEEPNDALDPETLGVLASIGIEKGKPFAPDERMKEILTDSAAVGNATARANLFRTRLKEAYFYPNSAWCIPFVGGSYEFLLQPGVRNFDARTVMFYYATGITPAMAAKMVGVGSQYAGAFVDSTGKPLDGSKTYKVHEIHERAVRQSCAERIPRAPPSCYLRGQRHCSRDAARLFAAPANRCRHLRCLLESSCCLGQHAPQPVRATSGRLLQSRIAARLFCQRRLHRAMEYQLR